jgi:hypothetical protein
MARIGGAKRERTDRQSVYLLRIAQERKTYGVHHPVRRDQQRDLSVVVEQHLLQVLESVIRRGENELDLRDGSVEDDEGVAHVGGLRTGMSAEREEVKREEKTVSSWRREKDIHWSRLPD